MSALREELIARIRRLPEEGLLPVAMIVQEVEENQQRRSMAEALERARAFRARMKAKYGVMPDTVEALRQVREERLNDILDSMR